jgi:hypothetical protein
MRVTAPSSSGREGYFLDENLNNQSESIFKGRPTALEREFN